nr:MAG TPA: hypothetical protein [Caudoviricetes sp.]
MIVSRPLLVINKKENDYPSNLTGKSSLGGLIAVLFTNDCAM